MAEYYDYSEIVKEDVFTWIRENKEDIIYRMESYEAESLSDIEDWIIDECFCCDYVTGNVSGSYFCDSYEAESAISHNWDLLYSAIAEFGETTIDPSLGAEHYDVIIRCYLVGQAVHEAVEELEESEAWCTREED